MAPETAESVSLTPVMSERPPLRQVAVIANPVLELAGYDALPVEGPPDPDDALRRYEMELTLKAAQAGRSDDD